MSRVVYFARVGDYVKVGATGKLPRRMTEMRCAAHRSRLRTPERLRHKQEPVTLIGTLPDAPGLEAKCHRELGAYHSVGEWFSLTPETLGAVARILRRPQAPVVEQAASGQPPG